MKNIAYCKLNLCFDQDTFIKEYDEFILPNSEPIANGKGSWATSRGINRQWKMVDPELYDSCDVQDTHSTNIIKRGTPVWLATSLIELDTSDPDMLTLSRIGSVALRNALLDNGQYRFKEQYKNLEITKWIQALPFSKIIGVRCVSLASGSFASIHRDENSLSVDGIHKSLDGNKLWDSGFVSITLNISDGGQPIYYAINSNVSNAFKANDQVYMFNDYCHHGVPVVTSRRRQIRITGIPSETFSDIMCMDSVQYIR
jgi:hypothetical protein